MSDKHFVYIARCRDGVLYTGYTNDMDKRMKNHNEGKGAKFTRGRGPLLLVYFEEFASKGQAMTREAEIKRLARPAKLRLIGESANDRDS